jgi:hypothetical protein
LDEARARAALCLEALGYAHARVQAWSQQVDEAHKQVQKFTADAQKFLQDAQEKTVFVQDVQRQLVEMRASLLTAQAAVSVNQFQGTVRGAEEFANKQLLSEQPENAAFQQRVQQSEEASVLAASATARVFKRLNEAQELVNVWSQVVDKAQVVMQDYQTKAQSALRNLQLAHSLESQARVAQGEAVSMVQMDERALSLARAAVQAQGGEQAVTSLDWEEVSTTLAELEGLEDGGASGGAELDSIQHHVAEQSDKVCVVPPTKRPRRQRTQPMVALVKKSALYNRLSK